MNKQKQNKQFILEYYNSISGNKKTDETIDRYVNDDELKKHILFFEAIMPGYEILVDEMTAEGNRVVVLARAKGKHEGEMNGIPPTHRNIEINFVIGYIIDKGKIVDHWMISDRMSLMEQLGAKP